MEVGISSDTFWDMSISDVRDEIEAHYKADKRRQQQLSTQSYNTALLVGLAVNDVLTGKSRFPSSLEKAFPNLFEKESTAIDWRESKAYMEQLKIINNRKMKGGDTV